METELNNRPLLHIFLVNFHHKKGSQIEFVYPPFEFTGSSSENVPSTWKYLPTFCLPDGAHNVSNDTVFFTLPDVLNPKKSVFGVACYRQIAVEDLKVVTEDITRSSVQKSVCALLSLPIYGYIEVKLSLIADAFFNGGDFANIDILIKAYDQLNSVMMNGDPIESPLRHLHVGLNLRDLFLKWRHKLLILFKLFLLQKRVIFFGSPVRSTCSTIIGIMSLYPELMAQGFDEVFCVKTSRAMSPMTVPNDDEKSEVHEKTVHDFESERKTSLGSNNNKADMKNEAQEPPHSLQRETSMDALYSTMAPYCSIRPDKWCGPIPIYRNGNLLCPYLSLPYMDLLQDPSVHSYVIGASNILFKQKRQLADVFVETETGKIELNDPNSGDVMELRKLLELSTEDRRFIDHLVKHVQNPKEGAEGSENWIREQFYGYTVALLRTSLCTGGSKELDQFNGHFMTIFRRTDAYDDWSSARIDTDEFKALPPGHPFAGNLSVADMKLRIAQSMHNTESGRKINQAVNQTSKVVGGAISTAKSTFTSWWSSITTTQTGTPADDHHEMSRNVAEIESKGTFYEENEEIPKRGRIESCVEAIPINDSQNRDVTDGESKVNNNKKQEQPTRRRKESTKEELEEIIQKTADKLIEYAKEVDPGFPENRKGKVFTV
uniref:CSON008327 protein n=1 Tax=Culicoides sonorensis TaxID=179676 RepID=A0A336KFQ2_CULSO